MKKSLVLSLHAFINWYILRSSCMSVPYRRRKFEHETIRGLRKEVVWNILYIIIASKGNCYIQNNGNIIIWVSLFELKLILTIVFLCLRIHIQLKYKLLWLWISMVAISIKTFTTYSKSYILIYFNQIQRTRKSLYLKITKHKYQIETWIITFVNFPSFWQPNEVYKILIGFVY